MTGALRIALFAALLALVFGGAAVAGSALDPDPDADQTHPQAQSGPAEEHGKTRHERRTAEKEHTRGHEAARGPAGPALTEAGLRLEVDRRRLGAGRQERLAFRIVREEGRTVRDFQVDHDRRMHLIAVRRDLTGFQHLHPEMAPDGTWSTPLQLHEPGSYRLFADFRSRGSSHTLGADVHVAGPFEPRPLPHPSDRAASGDGYDVHLAEDAGAELRFTVYLDGRRVEDIEPYLGARGHLVALREGDLAFLHVHPESEATQGGDIRFRVEYPSAGRYRLFLQFKHDGRVRTVAFTKEKGVGHGH